MHLPLALRSRRSLVWLTVLLTAGGMSACNDPFERKAQFSNVDRSLELWALSGSLPVYPSAVIVAAATVTRLDVDGAFDLAFDIDAQGRLVIYPQSRIVQPLTGSRSVAVQASTTAFDALLEAPRTGWLADSVLRIERGGVFLARVSTPLCQFNASQEVYAKFVLDSLDVVGRRIKLSTRVNPNCGFRSLVAGLPEF